MFSLLVPYECGGCGRHFLGGELKGGLPGLCEDCSGRLERELVAGEELLDPLAVGTTAASLPLLSCGAFEGLLRELIRRLKYSGQWGLSRPLGRVLAERASTIPGPTCQGLVPVPIHWSRFASRGFNQSWLLGDRVGQGLSCPPLPALMRRSAFRPQVGLPESERKKNVADVFSLRSGHRSKISGRDLLLVDDVCTTGATLRACAGVLQEAGAASVQALVLARTTRSGDETAITCL
ncbi:MAG: ComF family protein [Myxococcota bacterium]|nr:ComF family protein [Myxococcota bacterium]